MQKINFADNVLTVIIKNELSNDHGDNEFSREISINTWMKGRYKITES